MTYGSQEEIREALGRYLFNARHYLENAYRLLEQNEVPKAGECVSGSMASAIKALAAYRGNQLRMHRMLGEYARCLAKELGDKSIYDSFVKAQHLHSNFYENDLTKEDVAAIAEDVRGTVGRLRELVPADVRRELQEKWKAPGPGGPARPVESRDLEHEAGA